MVVLGRDGHVCVRGEQTFVELGQLGRRLAGSVREVGLDERRQRLIDGIDDVDLVATRVQDAAEELADAATEIRRAWRTVSGTTQEHCNAQWTHC